MTNLTDLEISKALALAIGWHKSQVHWFTYGVYIQRQENGCWVVDAFDYRDWNVIGPIAEKFDCFPRWNGASWESVGLTDYVYANTPQKAIALAVIQGAKK